MNCPNCNQSFTLRYDYACHLQLCRPSDVTSRGRGLSPARPLTAADSLYVEFGLAEPGQAGQRDPVARPRSN